ncbi:hypothetical protein IGI04_001507, partial [Brassica rapa subsp. trilocularis]
VGQRLMKLTWGHIVGEVLGKASSSWWLGELLSLIVECLCIQDAWTEQWFPLSRFEVPGFWSYRLAASSSDKCGLGAEVEGTGWRAIGSSGTSRPLTFTLHPSVGFSCPSVGFSRRFLWAFGSGAISFCCQLVYEYR